MVFGNKKPGAFFRKTFGGTKDNNVGVQFKTELGYTRGRYILFYYRIK
jgi:hypothetical protein